MPCRSYFSMFLKVRKRVVKEFSLIVDHDKYWAQGRGSLVSVINDCSGSDIYCYNFIGLNTSQINFNKLFYFLWISYFCVKFRLSFAFPTIDVLFFRSKILEEFWFCCLLLFIFNHGAIELPQFVQLSWSICVPQKIFLVILLSLIVGWPILLIYPW